MTPRTRAILPVHLYGHPVEMQPLLDFARVHGLWVIEDASQAHGATYHGQRVGSMGDIGCFSLYYSKNLGAYGEAGIWVIGDKKLAEAVSMLRDHGSRVRYRHEMLGTNARLDEMQAAVLRVKLPHLEEWNAARQAHAQVYTEQLQGVVGTLPVVRAGNTHVFYVYVVQVQEREQFRQALGQAGIATGVHYPIPVHLQPACAHFGYSRGMLPVTEAVAERIVSLPMYPELTAEQIQAGDLGKIYCVEAERVNLGLYRSDINVIWDLAPHDISILLYLFGQEVEQINVQAHTHLQTGIHDIAHLDLTYVDGMTARIHVSWLHPCKIRRVTVIGDARMVVYDDTNPAEMIKIYNKGADVDVDPVVSYRFGAITIPHIDWMEPMHLECEDFVNAIRTKEEPHSNGKFGLEVVRILAAAQEVQQAQEEQQALVRTLQRLSDKASS